MQQLIVVFDGDCGLCSALVRFLRGRDRRGALQFVPAENLDLWEGGRYARHTHLAADTLVCIDAEKRLLTRSTALIALLRCLGGAWGWLALLLGCVPRPLRDLAYRIIAHNRYRL